MSSTVRPCRTGFGDGVSVYQLCSGDARVVALARKQHQAALSAVVDAEKARQQGRRTRPRKRASRHGNIDISREDDRRLGLARGESGPVHEANVSDPSYDAAWSELYEDLRAGLGELPYENRVILFGMVALGLNSRAVAEVLGMAHTTVCGRLNRTLVGLAGRLEPHRRFYQEG